MQKAPLQSPKQGFGVIDILYIVFKHKWKIAIFSLLGFSGAAFVHLKREPLYQSHAKLLVRYVLNRNTVDPYQSQMSPAGGSGDHVINTEIEILTSEDLALAVAEAVGKEKLLPRAAGEVKLNDAAGKVLAHLEVTAVPGNNVLHVVYGNPDAELSVEVLRKLIEKYFLKHLEIHRSAAAFDIVSKQAEAVGTRLKATETELDKLRTGSGITTLAEATGALATQRARTQDDLMSAKAELAEQTARIKSLESAAGIEESTSGGDAVAGTNAKPAASQVPPHVLTEYKSMQEFVAFLQKRDLELRMKFKSGNRLVALNEQQLNDYETRRRALTAKYPGLVAQVAVLESDPENPKWDLITERAKLASITAKVEIFTTHLEEIKQQFNDQYSIGARIETLERTRQMEDAEYRSLELSLKNAKVDQTLDPSRMPNITMVQQPSQPLKTYDKITQKIVLGLAGGGMAIGLGLAFLIELLFDRRIKRPTEIQARLQLPLLLSIPYIRRKDRGGLMLANESSVPRIGNGDIPDLPAAVEDESPRSAVRKRNHFILPYSETIRDRIIFNFEMNNVTHKPKLVAVAGLSEGAGTSTIAAGLAKSFSEMTGVKVLLVDLSSYHPEENPLFGEIPRHSLNGALQLAKGNKFKESNQALYYAGATARRDDSGLTTFSPLHLYELMPHLQGSDFDYIIFDMPPIDQTSRTLTMAGLMDKVLLVLDAENTSRDSLKWGYSELIKGKADVSCIFNKTRTHAPGWLIGES